MQPTTTTTTKHFRNRDIELPEFQGGLTLWDIKKYGGVEKYRAFVKENFTLEDCLEMIPVCIEDIKCFRVHLKDVEMCIKDSKKVGTGVVNLTSVYLMDANRPLIIALSVDEIKAKIEKAV